jgi:hypothetical protein
MSKKQKKKRNKAYNPEKNSAFWEGSLNMKGLAGKGYKPMDNRQVTHNLRRRMGK